MGRGACVRSGHTGRGMWERYTGRGAEGLVIPEEIVTHRRNRGAERKDLSRHPASPKVAGGRGGSEAVKLELVLKSDTVGTLEAARNALSAVRVNGVDLVVIEAAVGDISKSDLLMALTGSRLVVGFNVDVVPTALDFARERDIELRTYEVIDRMVQAVEGIARSLVPGESGEVRLGEARVIALFKGGRKGVILGCEVLKGRLALGQRYRVISAMGPIYEGRIESLHIEADAVREARVGEQVGLKVRGWRGAEVGDLVESYELSPRSGREVWHPRGGLVE